MTISELITQLEAIRAEHGDLPLVVREPAMGVEGIIVCGKRDKSVMLAIADGDEDFD